MGLSVSSKQRLPFCPDLSRADGVRPDLALNLGDSFAHFPREVVVPFLRHVDRVAAAEPCLEARRHAADPFSGYGFAIDASSGLSDLSSANAYLCFAGITIFWHSSCLITRTQMPALFVHPDGVTRLS